MVLTSRICREVNEKQVEAFNAVMGMVAYYEQCQKVRDANTEAAVVARTLKKEPPNPIPIPAPTLSEHKKRQFFYGGAIRGGKTYLYLTILVILCKLYPGCRCHIIRKSFTELCGITESSLLKILGNAPVRWKRSTKEYYVQFQNGSRIYFFSENFAQDPNGNRFLGLETNFVLLEQMEELQMRTLDIVLSRIASWRMAKEAPGIVFGTFNPTFCWVKEKIFDAWARAKKTDTLDALPFHYTPALPNDNKTNTEEQWLSWQNLDPVTYARLISGQWEIDMKGRFMHAFDQNKHISDTLAFDPGWPLRYSFDFNVDPSCAIVFQTDHESFFHILDEVRIENGDTPLVCDVLKERWRPLKAEERVNGDASGLARMSGLRGHLNQYQVIKEELDIPEDQFDVATDNPDIPDSRVFCNSIWHRFPSVKVHRRCTYLIHDLNFVLIKRDAEGRVGIKKTGKLANAPMNAESMGHLLDCSRYAMHTTLFDFVSIPRS